MISTKNPPIKTRLSPHLVIENISPMVDGGKTPLKRIVGQSLVIEADIFRDGTPLIRAALKWKKSGEKSFQETAMEPLENDRWKGQIPLDSNARYFVTIEAWTDAFGTWKDDFLKRVAAKKNVASDLAEGDRIVAAYLANGETAAKALISSTWENVKKQTGNTAELTRLLAEPKFLESLGKLDPREDRTEFSPLIEVMCDRVRAEFSSWYELFVRSETSHPKELGTFHEAQKKLAQIKELGFDVVYLAPIHPIGRTARKGPNNAEKANPGDPGSPWAIGNENGGHESLDPDLGTLDDFKSFVKKAQELGMEIAMDFAIQCSPDHPWVKEHPDWFYRRADGSIRYAENPPFEYQDIYPLNFDSPDRENLWNAWRDVFLHWIGLGVKIFRVDNPHTKPVQFWSWLIRDIYDRYPEVIFLAEAFTRPKVMKSLSKAGFQQSYTYFIWRSEKREIIDYLTELTKSEMKEYFRPIFFPTTPDILPEHLQTGGRPAFQARAILAGTLSPSYGIYSGYEFCEGEAIPGTAEYLNSEKFEIKVRDWNKAGNIKDLFGKLNRARNDHPALQQFLNLTFIPTDNDKIIAYAKHSTTKDDVVIIVINLDPHHEQRGTVEIPEELLAWFPARPFGVVDLLSEMSFSWGAKNYVILNPQDRAGHLLWVKAARAK